MQIQTPGTSTGISPFPGDETQTEIASAHDIVTARERARARAIALGFGLADVILLAAAISEIARNIVDHARNGRIAMRVVETEDRRGLQIVGRDCGPGIPDVARVLQYGGPGRRRTGVGLPGVKWLVDDFEVVSAVGHGTIVTMTKWVPA